LNPSSIEDTDNSSVRVLILPELDFSAKILLSQLRLLLGLPTHNPDIMLGNPINALGKWEFQIALRRNLEGTLQSAVSTLKAAVGVAHNLTNIKIPDEISQNCQEAIDALMRVTLNWIFVPG
jgi:hypothetical protein